ncbi:unnamed protein product [Amoebophrya sp. A120]|nr:unnamed protein product [Amoebophrya sp. A120]|eukprot:GSA120T00022918001.1
MPLYIGPWQEYRLAQVIANHAKVSEFAQHGDHRRAGGNISSTVGNGTSSRRTQSDQLTEYHRYWERASNSLQAFPTSTRKYSNSLLHPEKRLSEADGTTAARELLPDYNFRTGPISSSSPAAGKQQEAAEQQDALAQFLADQGRHAEVGLSQFARRTTSSGLPSSRPRASSGMAALHRRGGGAGSGAALSTTTNLATTTNLTHKKRRLLRIESMKKLYGLSTDSQTLDVCLEDDDTGAALPDHDLQQDRGQEKYFLPRQAVDIETTGRITTPPSNTSPLTTTGIISSAAVEDIFAKFQNNMLQVVEQLTPSKVAMSGNKKPEESHQHLLPERTASSSGASSVIQEGPRPPPPVWTSTNIKADSTSGAASSMSETEKERKGKAHEEEVRGPSKQNRQTPGAPDNPTASDPRRETRTAETTQMLPLQQKHDPRQPQQDHHGTTPTELQLPHGAQAPVFDRRAGSTDEREEEPLPLADHDRAQDEDRQEPGWSQPAREVDVVDDAIAQLLKEQRYTRYEPTPGQKILQKHYFHQTGVGVSSPGGAARKKKSTRTGATPVENKANVPADVRKDQAASSSSRRPHEIINKLSTSTTGAATTASPALANSPKGGDAGRVVEKKLGVSSSLSSTSPSSTTSPTRWHASPSRRSTRLTPASPWSLRTSGEDDLIAWSKTLNIDDLDFT